MQSKESMRTASTTTILALCLVTISWGCQSSIPGKQDTNDTPGHVGGSGGGGGSQVLDDAGVEPALPSESLTLISAKAHVDGRRGQRVRLSVTGKQVKSGLASVGVTALDASGNPIYWYSTRHDSQLDSTTGYLVPTTIPTESNFSIEVEVPFTNALLLWAQAKVTLFDREDAVSNELLVSVEPQPVRSKDQACDPTARLDRCDPKSDCNATSSTCVSRTGPSLTQAAYLTTADGPRMLALGTDDSDVTNAMNIDFYDASGAPVQVDMDNDPTSPRMAPSFLEENTGFASSGGQFIFDIAPTETFAAVVKQVGLTPIDVFGAHGNTIKAELMAQPSRGSGQSCDIHGFDYCSGNAVCSPGLPGANNSCQPTGTVQGKACGAAALLDISQLPAIVTGYSQGSSAWEVPAYCAPSSALQQSESIVRLRVPTAMDSITLSTDRRETQVDTVVYILSACGSASARVLDCNDDGPAGNLTSTVVLTNVSAGDYYVVVDSASGGGGPFGLIATVP